MDKKLKMRKNVILYMFGMLAVLMGCFFYTPKEAHAAGRTCVNLQISNTVQTVVQQEDVPEDAIKPLTRGKSLLSELVKFAGWAAFILGLAFFGFSWFSHQMDQRIGGFIAMIVGAVISFGPKIADWITS
mgnify:FL=1